uniref:PDZ domain-containing protein n=1 Tax=Steinernema glaseri TaxID=37863 RepID=A0A1I7YJJ4_9BILA
MKSSVVRLGVMCRAFNHDLHADCFTCATCGSSLKNQGHHFLNDKFYCDIHGRQLMGRGPSMDPEKAARSPPTAVHPVKTPEPVKAFYQPEVMTRQPISLKSVSPTPWNTTSPISPSKRGVPPSHTGFGQQIRQTTTTSHYETSPNHLTPNSNIGGESVRRSPVPPEIRRVTSPRLPRSPRVANWPPKQQTSEKSNRFWHISPETKVADKWLSLQEIVHMEDENRKARRPPSPKRYLLRGETRKPELNQLPQVHVRVSEPNGHIPDPAVEHNQLVSSMYDNITASGSHNGELSVSHSRDRSTESIPGRWGNISEIVEERDIITENSSIRRSDDDSSASLKGITKPSDDESTVDQFETESEDEQEKWMREEVEQARKEKELAEHLEHQRLVELANDVTDDCELDTDFDRDTEMSEIFDTQEERTHSPFDDLEETEPLYSSAHVLDPLGAKEPLEAASFVTNRVTKVDPQPTAVSPLISEEDKRMAIESIERHQRTLQDQQQQLSALLDDAILFLKGLDSDFSSKYLETPLIANRVREKEEQEQSESKERYEDKPSSYDSASSKIVRALNLRHDEQDAGNNNYTRTETHQHYEHQQQQQQQQNNNHYQQEHTEGNRGKGTLMSNVNRIPYCEHCKQQIRGAFVLATGLTWCPEHFTCANQSCGRKLLDVGFVEEKGKKYCEQCFERLIAPQCSKCRKPITADCLNALQKQWHPHCFVCAHCHKPFGNSAFYLEQGQPYCEEDWNSLFTTKCVSCKFPIEAGDRWVEALGSAFHSNCFNCTTCQINLEGESFYAKNGAPYCKAHA